MMMDHKRYILLFDGVCNLCSGMVKFIIRRDPDEKFRFSALQSDLAQSIIKSHNLNQHSLNTLILVEGKTLFIKSDAVLQILKELKGPWKFFYVLKIIPKPVRDFIYDITAKTRYAIFGIRDSCMVPDAGIRHRFF